MGDLEGRGGLVISTNLHSPCLALACPEEALGGLARPHFNQLSTSKSTIGTSDALRAPEVEDIKNFIGCHARLLRPIFSNSLRWARNAKILGP